MSKHNYSQYSNKNRNEQNKQNNQKAIEKKVEASEVKMEVTPAPVVMQETVETVSLPTTVKGIVARCSKLNVREKPIVTSDIVGVLDARSEIEIDVKKSTASWFHVCSASGVEGYCMREYIDARM